MYWDYVETPVGVLEIRADGAGLTKCTLVEQARVVFGNWVTNLAKRELLDYFAGTLRRFSVPLTPKGTPFQQTVWDVLQRMPYGFFMTYGALALEVDKPNGARAVGNAVGRNPLLIFVPCHRILPKLGGLGGFSAGVEMKRWLVDHERNILGNV